jgi:hypothetical protein
MHGCQMSHLKFTKSGLKGKCFFPYEDRGGQSQKTFFGEKLLTLSRKLHLFIMRKNNGHINKMAKLTKKRE